MDYIYKKEQHILYPNWEWTRYVISFIMIVCLDNLQKKNKKKKELTNRQLIKRIKYVTSA